MLTHQILLDSTRDVTDFVHIVNQYAFEFDLVSGRYIVDGKSIMGIFSLDLKKPCTLRIHTEKVSEEELTRIDDLLQRISPYLIDNHDNLHNQHHFDE